MNGLWFRYGMKHSVKVTLILLLLFLMAQFIGLGVVYSYIDTEQTAATGETVFEELPIGERPPVEERTSYLPILLAIIIGTIVMLLLAKYKLQKFWKVWFVFAVVIALTVAFGAFLPAIIAFIIGLVLGAWKIFRPHLYIHTFTELFIYGGLAAIFVPLLNLWSVSVLLVLIAIYDMYAVWKSGHMVKLAKSQTKQGVFAGLLVPYKLPQKPSKKTVKKTAAKVVAKSKKVPQKIRTAILGGGDIGFPLIFAGVILKEIGLWQSLIIPFFALAGLALLLWKAEKKKFYPAMPFIGLGCFVGLGVVWLVSLLL